MTRPTQGTGGPDGRPRCYNGWPMREYVANDGLTFDGGQFRRTITWQFSQECKSWASDPSTDPVPMAEGWRCDGCKHLPQRLVDLAIQNRERRRTSTAGG